MKIKPEPGILESLKPMAGPVALAAGAVIALIALVVMNSNGVESVEGGEGGSPE